MAYHQLLCAGQHIGDVAHFCTVGGGGGAVFQSLSSVCNWAVRRGELDVSWSGAVGVPVILLGYNPLPARYLPLSGCASCLIWRLRRPTPIGDSFGTHRVGMATRSPDGHTLSASHRGNLAGVVGAVGDGGHCQQCARDFFGHIQHIAGAKNGAATVGLIFSGKNVEKNRTYA